ncbi:hypothetical protein BH24BAC1_BH24BAC1_25260 [soil metagenome]
MNVFLFLKFEFLEVPFSCWLLAFSGGEPTYFEKVLASYLLKTYSLLAALGRIPNDVDLN